MTTFDKREEGFEKKFAHGRGTAVQGGRPPQQAPGPLGGRKAGPLGAEAEAYAKSVVVADFEEAGDEDVFRKIRRRFRRQVGSTSRTIRSAAPWTS